MELRCSCRGGDEECVRCEGTGTIDGKRLMAIANADPRAARGARRLLDSFVSYHAHGLLPVVGGLADQSASFLEALHVARSEVGQIELEAQREREREAERARLRASANAARGRVG